MLDAEAWFKDAMIYALSSYTNNTAVRQSLVTTAEEGGVFHCASSSSTNVLRIEKKLIYMIFHEQVVTAMHLAHRVSTTRMLFDYSGERQIFTLLTQFMLEDWVERCIVAIEGRRLVFLNETKHRSLVIPSVLLGRSSRYFMSFCHEERTDRQMHFMPLGPDK